MAKQKRRNFQFSTEIEEYGIVQPGPHSWVNEVIESIETDTIQVYDPKDTSALDDVFNDQDDECLEGRLSLTVPLREWIPVGCQCVRWFSPLDMVQASRRGSLAWYENNAATVLWPIDRLPMRVQGPAAFVGEIAINRQDWAFEEDKFKFVLAHELVHVFDMLKLLIPAFMDWRSFWKHALHEGDSCEDAARRYAESGTLIDDYGCASERQCIQQYWPSQAGRWFKAFRAQGRSV